MRWIHAFILTVGLSTSVSAEVRIKDITRVAGGVETHLIGYGLVVGLGGTGDAFRNIPSTEQSLQSMLDRMGLNIRGLSLRNKNVAAVIVTAEISSTTSVGSRLDVSVSALGDATSLSGGTLLMTPLSAANGDAYAVAQGTISVNGFEAAGQAETLTQGTPTTGRISNGAIIQKTVEAPPDNGNILLDLSNPDYTTATRAIEAINEYGRRRYLKEIAQESGPERIVITKPRNVGLVRFLSEIGEITIAPDTRARVVVDARSGTVVAGQDVQISTVAITHGSLTVRITETPVVSQPPPRSGGQTTVAKNTRIDADQNGGPLAVIRGASLRALVDGLNKMGLKPQGIIAILQAIKAAGALQAELIVQ